MNLKKKQDRKKKKLKKLLKIEIEMRFEPLTYYYPVKLVAIPLFSLDQLQLLFINYNYFGTGIKATKPKLKTSHLFTVAGGF